MLSLVVELGSKYQPIVIIDDGSEIEPEDTARLHERVVKVKQEIDWDLEEKKLREKRKERELKRQELSSSDESDSEYAEVRWRKRSGCGNRVIRATDSASVGTSDSIYDKRGRDGSRQLLTIAQNKRDIMLAELHPELDPDSLNETIAYSQEDHSSTQYSRQLLSPLLDITGAYMTEREDSECLSDIPLDIFGQLYSRPELESTSSVNGIISEGSLSSDKNSSCMSGSEFLLSTNHSTNTPTFKPTLEVHLADDSCEPVCRDALEKTIADRATFWSSEKPLYTLTSSENSSSTVCECPELRSTREDALSSYGENLLTRRVMNPSNVRTVIRIESQSSTDQDPLSGIASGPEDSPTWQPFSRDTYLSNPEVFSRPSQTLLEKDDALLLSGYESGYVCEDNPNSTPTPTFAQSTRRSSSTSLTPPPTNDDMTPPSSPESQKMTTSTPVSFKLNPAQLQLLMTNLPSPNEKTLSVSERQENGCHLTFGPPLTGSPRTSGCSNSSYQRCNGYAHAPLHPCTKSSYLQEEKPTHSIACRILATPTPYADHLNSPKILPTRLCPSPESVPVNLNGSRDDDKNASLPPAKRLRYM